MLDGKLLPICAFFTKVSVVTFSSAESKLSGNALIAVHSRCRVDKEAHEEILLGKAPSAEMNMRICTAQQKSRRLLTWNTRVSNNSQALQTAEGSQLAWYRRRDSGERQGPNRNTVSKG